MSEIPKELMPEWEQSFTTMQGASDEIVRLRSEVERLNKESATQRLALRNCRALAKRNVAQSGSWNDIIRFTTEGGIMDSLLRDSEVVQSAHLRKQAEGTSA